MSQAAWKYPRQKRKQITIAPHVPSENQHISPVFSQLSVSGTQGFVARDGKRKEIVVAFRGTLSLTDVLTGSDPNILASR